MHACTGTHTHTHMHSLNNMLDEMSAYPWNSPYSSIRSRFIHTHTHQWFQSINVISMLHCNIHRLFKLEFCCCCSFVHCCSNLKRKWKLKLCTPLIPIWPIFFYHISFMHWIASRNIIAPNFYVMCFTSLCFISLAIWSYCKVFFTSLTQLTWTNSKIQKSNLISLLVDLYVWVCVRVHLNITL